MDIAQLREKIIKGERRALSRAITLVESGRADHQAQAGELIAGLQGQGKAIRVGLSGTPGVGKSTFIESFGTMLTAQGLRVAVLAVDPSSARSGGSILGDKTRMDRLSRDPLAFIRPASPPAQAPARARRVSIGDDGGCLARGWSQFSMGRDDVSCHVAPRRRSF